MKNLAKKPATKSSSSLEMKFDVKTLPSGVRYIFIPMKQTETTTVTVLIGIGSEFETKQENGISHFLEHLCFKGTKNYPSYTDLFFEFDKIGARNNAFTGGLVTGYWAKSASEHSKRILELVTEIYLHPTFPESEMEREKGVIIQEINMYEDDPQAKVEMLSDKLVCGDQPAGRPIIGTKENVMSFTRQNIVDYRNAKYVPENTLIIVAGNFDQKEIEGYLKTHYGTLPKTKKPKREKTKTLKGPAVEIIEKQTDQTHFVLTFNSFDLFDKRLASASLLASVLGDGMSSRLWQKVREQLGLCYYISATMQAHPDGGTFVVRCGVGNDQLERAINAIVDELNRIKKEVVQKAELQKSKEYRMAGLVLNLETPQDWSDFVGSQLLVRGKIEMPSVQKAKIKGVTAAKIQDAAKAIFKASESFLAVIGPHKDTEKLKKILKKL